MGRGCHDGVEAFEQPRERERERGPIKKTFILFWMPHSRRIHNSVAKCSKCSNCFLTQTKKSLKVI